MMIRKYMKGVRKVMLIKEILMFGNKSRKLLRIYLKVFVSSNKILSSLFHCECGVQFYDESQIDILLPLIFKELDLNDHKKKSLGDA
jgi:hypothetical protein